MTPDELEQDFDLAIAQLTAINLVLTKTFEALARYDPTKSAAKERAKDLDADDY